MKTPEDINYLFSRKSKSKLPVGIIFDKSANRYRSKCYHSGEVTGIFTKDINAASKHYVLEKLNSVKIAYNKHYKGDDFMKKVLIRKLISFLEDNGHEQASHYIQEW
jgi:hypothetical protein